MSTSPEQVRAGLLTITAAATADAAAATAQATPQKATDLLAQLAPLVIAEYAPAAATLAADWYEELRADAQPSEPFAPFVVVQESLDWIEAEVARFAEQVERDLEADTAAKLAEMRRAADDLIRQEIARAQRLTITENTKADPAAVGWKRHARPEACKFCKMLAARGAVYTAETARFAAHGAITDGKRTGGDCMCIAGPAFGGKDVWAEATPMQYVASKRTRSAKERAELRDYLTKHFPNAPG